MAEDVSKMLAQTLSAHKENLLRYSVLLDLCPLPAFFLDANTKMPVYINPAYFDLTGRTLDELHTQNWLHLVVHSEDLANMLVSWNSFSVKETIFVQQHRYIHKNGLVTKATAVLKHLPPDSFVGFVLPRCDSDFECPIAKINRISSNPHS